MPKDNLERRWTLKEVCIALGLEERIIRGWWVEGGELVVKMYEETEMNDANAMFRELTPTELAKSHQDDEPFVLDAAEEEADVAKPKTKAKSA